jgi:hypothetical protein
MKGTVTCFLVVPYTHELWGKFLLAPVIQKRAPKEWLIWALLGTLGTFPQRSIQLITRPLSTIHFAHPPLLCFIIFGIVVVGTSWCKCWPSLYVGLVCKWNPCKIIMRRFQGVRCLSKVDAQNGRYSPHLFLHNDYIWDSCLCGIVGVRESATNYTCFACKTFDAKNCGYI